MNRATRWLLNSSIPSTLLLWLGTVAVASTFIAVIRASWRLILRGTFE